MLIVANWKAFVEDLPRAEALLRLTKRLARDSKHSFVLAPPAPLLGALARKNTSAVAFAAQDISPIAQGARTGDISAQIYAAAGASYAIVGHSERRARGDTDEVVAEKLSHALAQGLTPVLCVGEKERDAEGRYLASVREEITSALSVLEPKERSKVVLAYEPVWAIGKSAADAIRPADLAEMILYIRKVLAEMLPGKSSSRSLVLYGGSVEPENVRDLAAGSGADGFLIGHASTDPQSFRGIAKALS